MSDINNANWFSLKQSIEDGDVIPVIGPDALMVEAKDQTGFINTVPFYRLVATDLLKTFQTDLETEILEHSWALHKAVSAILAKKNSRVTEQGIRREISRLIAHYSEVARPAESLRLLVSIPAFTQFVSLTPDNLLQRAMREIDDTKVIRVSKFFPQMPSEPSLEHPDNLSGLRQGERRIFQILGSSANKSSFAVHEEDALEYIYTLQFDKRFANILADLRHRGLLFIGCNFPDWLGRTFLRLVNTSRFNGKETLEFLCPIADDQQFNAFLTQYSPSTLGFEGKSGEFIAQLAKNFGSVSPPPKPVNSNLPGSQGPTVFVSYASENADVARRIADKLLNLGFSNVWLDKKKLIGGDDWSDRISEAINKCDFFVPVLSKEADARREGVFWDEWKTAVERSRRIKDAYLLPVGIDSTPPTKNSYRRISDGHRAEFFYKHLIHAPDGFLTTEDCDALKERCRRFLESYHG